LYPESHGTFTDTPDSTENKSTGEIQKELINFSQVCDFGT